MIAQNIYPFPEDVVQKSIHSFGFWKKLVIKLFGEKYSQVLRFMVFECYYYKDVIYITKYQRIDL